MDFAFLMSYAIGQVTIGHEGDRINLKYFTSGGMFIAASALITIGIL